LGEQNQPLTGVDVLDAVYVVVVNFVAPLVLMAFFYSRILLVARRCVRSSERPMVVKTTDDTTRCISMRSEIDR